MNVLILHAEDAEVKKVAGVIAQGAKEVKAEVTLCPVGKPLPPAASFDFVFVGLKLGPALEKPVLSALTPFAKKNAAFFFLAAKPDSKAMETATNQLTALGLTVTGTFCAVRQGPLTFLGMGPVKDADVIRARGFAERTLNTTFGLAFGNESEKTKIKGYLK